MKTKVLAVSGLSGTGKTTLVSLIVRELRSRGYSIMTIKHTQHHILPPEGSDTRRHWDAGATATVLLGNSSTTITQSYQMTLSELMCIERPDFVIIEGMKRSNIPKIWCLDHGEQKIPEGIKRVVGLFRLERVENKSSAEKNRVFTLKDISGIADLIENRAIDADSIDRTWRTSKA